MTPQEEQERYRYLQLKMKMEKSSPNTRPQGPSLLDKAGNYVKSGSYLPAIGATIGGVAGSELGPGSIGTAALGGAAGESLRQMIQRSRGQQSPQTSMEALKGIGGQAALSAAGEGAGQVAGAALRPLAEPIKKAASKLGNVGAKGVEAITGLKVPDIAQTFKQGMRTYMAPSMEKAQDIFGSALKKEGIAARQPLKQLIDPQLTGARKVAIEVGEKLEKGINLTAEDALRGRQALDRIIEATPLRDRATRGSLMELRSSFDDVLSNKSGALANASKIYRKAIVKNNILNPIKLTKSGQYSAVAPMLASMAGTAVGGSQHSPVEGIGTTAGVMAASSPLLYGLATASGGDIVRGIAAIAKNPAVQRMLIQELIRRRNSSQSQMQGQSTRASAVQP